MLRSLATRCTQLRCLHTTQVMRLDPATVEEVKIPVPWGYIAGRWWGRKENPLILAVHGWQDNAGSWDPLLEKFPDSYSVLAIDMPGNGQSSHYPPFVNYSYLDSPSILKRVVNYLNRRVHLLGHSGGSAVCFIFASTFPEDALSYCGVDYLTHCYKNEDVRVTKLAKDIDATINMALRDPRKSKHYSWEEVKERLVAATHGSVSLASAEILMQRGVNKLPNGKVVLSRDNRYKSSDLNLVRVEQLQAIVKNFKTHTCLIRGKQSIFFYDKGIKHFPGVLDILEKQCSLYQYVEIDGGHHLHMDKPDEVSNIYLNFLEKVKSST